MVSPFKRYLHKWPQNSPFLPVMQAEQAKIRFHPLNIDLFQPV